MKEYHFEKDFSYSKGSYTVCWVKLICDKCKRVITDTTESEFEQRELSEQYRDLNWGHECDSCRKSREIRYDIYVTSPWYGRD